MPEPALTSVLDRGLAWILMLEGRARLALAFGAGAVAALAQAPFDVLPAYALAFPVLVLLLDGSFHTGGRGAFVAMRAAAAIGWAFGFGYFLFGLWWLGVAFVVGGEDFIWLMPLGVIGLPAVLALFPALGLVLARALWSGSALRLLALASGLSAAEALRATMFTGFPWNSFGQAFANHLVLAQGVSVLGTEALGALAIAVFAAPATCLTGRGLFGRVFPLVQGGLLIAVLAIFGLIRLEAAGGERVDFTRMPVVPDVRIRIVQPAISHAERLDPDFATTIVRRLLTLSDRARGPHAAGLQDATHIFWPEAPFPFLIDRNKTALAEITAALPPKARIITGAIRAEHDPARPRNARFYNSLFAIDGTGIAATYDKSHLVPFGEFLPFEAVLRSLGLRQFVDVVGGFSPAEGRKHFDVPGLPPVTPLICYEVIFSNEINAGASGPGVLVNVTNDAWFGDTPGPRQHLAQARLRAIEFGLPLVRAANSGISAVIDPYGRILASLPLGAVDVLDAPLPVALISTLYRRTSWYSFASVMVLMLLGAFLGRGLFRTW